MESRTLTAFCAMVMALGAAGCAPQSARVADAPKIDKKRVIILCTGNSCRSQMAEAIWRKEGGDRWEVVSAGTNPKPELFPPAIKVMAEKGIDISSQKPKNVSSYVNQDFDLVITVCENAEKNCPNFRRGKRHLHWPFEDPPKAAGGIAEQTRVCQRVGDEIETQIKQFLADDLNHKP